jgi:hypothetical protein
MARTMMTLILGLVAVLAISPVYGATNVMKVDVPFEFIAAGQTYPAGPYLVRVDHERRAFEILHWNGKYVGRFRGTTVVANRALDSGKAVFHKAGETYFLRQVWTGAQDTGYEVPESKLERELARTGQKIDIAEVRR